jgi:predicted MPP superfamily phosphohydrolase
VAGLAWGWFEAGWLRRRVLEVPIDRLPPELDGLRIAHLSDLHLGGYSRGVSAVVEAVEWVTERRPDLVVVTGDLVARRSGMRRLEELLRALGPCIVILGNHDFGDSRDPFSQRVDVDAIAALPDVTVLRDEAVELTLYGGATVQIVGVDPQTYAARRARPDQLADPDASFRILLCHFPRIARLLPESFDLILAGHYHAGQIVLPLPGRRLPLAHLRARDVAGVYRYGSTAMHVSPGLGTTFVPFRFFARPEVTELVVRSTG